MSKYFERPEGAQEDVTEPYVLRNSFAARPVCAYFRFCAAPPGGTLDDYPEASDARLLP